MAVAKKKVKTRAKPNPNGPVPKAQLMRELRKRRKDAGLHKVEVFVTADKREAVARYVTEKLGGECNVKLDLDK